MTKETAFQQKISRLTAQETTLQGVKEVLFPFLQEHSTLRGNLGYVAGPINADGPLYVQSNIQKLKDTVCLVKAIRPELSVFSSADVFTRGNLPAILTSGATEPDFYNFWDDLLIHSGTKHIFFAPRWNISTGARREYSMATRLNLNIYDLDNI